MAALLAADTRFNLAPVTGSRTNADPAAILSPEEITDYASILEAYPRIGTADENLVEIVVHENHGKRPGVMAKGNVVVFSKAAPVRKQMLLQHWARVYGLVYLGPEGDVKKKTEMNAQVKRAASRMRTEEMIEEDMRFSLIEPGRSASAAVRNKSITGSRANAQDLRAWSVGLTPYDVVAIDDRPIGDRTTSTRKERYLFISTGADSRTCQEFNTYVSGRIDASAGRQDDNGVRIPYSWGELVKEPMYHALVSHAKRKMERIAFMLLADLGLDRLIEEKKREDWKSQEAYAEVNLAAPLLIEADLTTLTNTVHCVKHHTTSVEYVGLYNKTICTSATKHQLISPISPTHGVAIYPGESGRPAEQGVFTNAFWNSFPAGIGMDSAILLARRTKAGKNKIVEKLRADNYYFKMSSKYVYRENLDGDAKKHEKDLEIDVRLQAYSGIDERRETIRHKLLDAPHKPVILSHVFGVVRMNREEKKQQVAQAASSVDAKAVPPIGTHVAGHSSKNHHDHENHDHGGKEHSHHHHHHHHGSAAKKGGEEEETKKSRKGSREGHSHKKKKHRRPHNDEEDE
jgi:hypothetical protein